MLGSRARAPAITTRWRWPPDSSWGRRGRTARRAQAAAGQGVGDQRLLVALDAVDAQALGHRLVHRLARVEGPGGVLEDQLDLAAVGLEGAVPRPIGLPGTGPGRWSARPGRGWPGPAWSCRSRTRRPARRSRPAGPGGRPRRRPAAGPPRRPEVDVQSRPQDAGRWPRRGVASRTCRRRTGGGTRAADWTAGGPAPLPAGHSSTSRSGTTATDTGQRGWNSQPRAGRRVGRVAAEAVGVAARGAVADRRERLGQGPGVGMGGARTPCAAGPPRRSGRRT
jgi:hypothetical protein